MARRDVTGGDRFVDLIDQKSGDVDEVFAVEAAPSLAGVTFRDVDNHPAAFGTGKVEGHGREISR